MFEQMLWLLHCILFMSVTIVCKAFVSLKCKTQVCGRVRAIRITVDYFTRDSSNDANLGWGIHVSRQQEQSSNAPTTSC